MKPKTKEQHYVHDLNLHIKPLSDAKVKWIHSTVLIKQGFRTKTRGITCLMCGCSYNDDTNICPSCGAKLTIIDSRARTAYSYYDVAFIETIKDRQLIRYFFVKHKCKKGYPADISINETVRVFISSKGKTTYVARSRYMSYVYDSAYNMSTPLEIKKPVYLYGSSMNVYEDYPDHICPRMKLIDELKRRFVPKVFVKNPVTTFKLLLSDNKFETLHKLRYEDIIGGYHLYRKEIDKYWPTLKICFRHKYQIPDCKLYFDTLDLLSYFNKDLHNPKYVCPDDLKAVHDLYMNKKKAIVLAQELKDRDALIKYETIRYQEAKRAYIGFKIVSDDLTIKTLDNVTEFFVIGEKLSHCIFSNEYYKKNNSLLLSINKDNTPIETAEIDITSFDLVQVRGYNNQITDEHEKILNALNKSIPLLRKHYKQNTKTI